MDFAVWLFFSLSCIGAFHVAAVCFCLLARLELCLRRQKDLRHKYGAWAIVTGPTAGIGMSMSMELARRGLNLVLVGRDAAKLRNISEKICRTHAVETKTVLFDLSQACTAEGKDAMGRFREAIQGLEIGDAAEVNPHAVFLHEADVESLVRIIRVNLVSLTQVSAAVLPVMLQQGRGTIVNIGSGSALTLPSFPLYSVYAATKRYVAEFSRSLSVEYKRKANMIANVKASYSPLFVPTAESFARAAVGWIGYGSLCAHSAVVVFQYSARNHSRQVSSTATSERETNLGKHLYVRV